MAKRFRTDVICLLLFMASGSVLRFPDLVRAGRASIVSGSIRGRQG